MQTLRCAQKFGHILFMYERHIPTYRKAHSIMGQSGFSVTQFGYKVFVNIRFLIQFGIPLGKNSFHPIWELVPVF